jgi:hypothetical protein
VYRQTAHGGKLGNIEPYDVWFSGKELILIDGIFVGLGAPQSVSHGDTRTIGHRPRRHSERSPFLYDHLILTILRGPNCLGRSCIQMLLVY